ncbi:hypothetical protein M9H77_26486 [Catharanthus roseus]|uniref:Uncharacterized protein n=1 Tax=Catharanthus roseus TaxID=4058 RepID=A0ACC0ACH7_CATRO|nr:hypothetical protein M9H77_26486 [Catharanthus roseus]
MATKLGRVFTAIAEQYKPKLGISYGKTEYSLNSATRLICSSTLRSEAQEKQQQDVKGEESPKQEVKMEIASEVEADDENEDGDHVNKETGEIGGPRGPEPTRYGDWERKGRCSDF